MTHPEFSGVISTYASIRDEIFDEHGFDPSLVVPRSREELLVRRRGSERLAELSGGMLSRTPEYVNGALSALEEATSWLSEADSQAAENVKNYVAWVRDNRITTCLTQSSPQASTTFGATETALHIADITDEGLLLSGARMVATNAPYVDEILILPSNVLRGHKDDGKYAFACAVRLDHPGISIVCRPGHAPGPLASRFDEIDAMVVFDEVLVEWDRVFMLGHADHCNSLLSRPGGSALMTYHSLIRTTAKTKFYADLISDLVDVTGKQSATEITRGLAEINIAHSLGLSTLRAAEVDGEMNEFGWYQPALEPLLAARQYFCKFLPTLSGLVKQVAGTAMATLPGGDVLTQHPDLSTFFSGNNIDGADKIDLFRVAYDASMSGFASRQELAEYFFFGDPARAATAYLSYLANR